MSERRNVSITVTGMTCASCSRIVEKKLSRVEGVVFAAVNLATETAFAVVEGDVSLETLEQAVIKAGYGVSHERQEDLEKRRYSEARRAVIISWMVTLPLMAMMIPHMMGRHVPGYLWMEIVGGALVLFGPGRKSMKGAWIALTHGHANMDVLVSAGALAAWSTSLLRAYGLSVASFGAISAMIIGLHVTGRFIESWLRDRAAREIKTLIGFQAREARILEESGEEVTLPIEAIKPGFVLLVRPGERFPSDGVVRLGSSSVDESMITGESMPVSRSAGDIVTGGSVNLSGSLEVTVTSTGEDSFLAQMIALIKEAQGSKIPIQAFADRVTGAFVPVVAALAVASGLFWYFNIDRLGWFLDWASRYLPWITDARDPLSIAVFAFVTTIVIACPCALGLATPMALITGTGAASKKGLIIKNAEAIQTLRDVGVVILDKTGTLTEGSPSVVHHNLDDEQASIVAAIEAHSNHPLALSISRIADQSQLVSTVEEIPGEGVYALVNGREWFAGRPLDGSIYSDEYDEGRTVVEVRRGSDVLGYVSLIDRIRPEAADGVARLKSLGIKPVMATGDNRATALKVAHHVGIDEINVYSEIHPEDKLNIVRQQQASGVKVLMVGDGMNDAAALKGADVGVAIGSGTDLAIDSADIVIVRGGIGGLFSAVEISRKTFSVIRQNLFWAFGYNFLALPLAMGAVLHPAIAEVAMTLSSISVILNSMRISR